MESNPRSARLSRQTRRVFGNIIRSWISASSTWRTCSAGFSLGAGSRTANILHNLARCPAITKYDDSVPCNSLSNHSIPVAPSRARWPLACRYSSRARSVAKFIPPRSHRGH